VRARDAVLGGGNGAPDMAVEGISLIGLALASVLSFSLSLSHVVEDEFEDNSGCVEFGNKAGETACIVDGRLSSPVLSDFSRQETRCLLPLLDA